MKGHMKEQEKERARGGKAMSESDGAEPRPYNAMGSPVEKEAEEKKDGGRAKKRARGGHVEGEHGKRRLDRAGRKRGGAAGADMTPLSSASKVMNASGHTATEGNAKDQTP